jgi:hypothetical protein
MSDVISTCAEIGSDEESGKVLVRCTLLTGEMLKVTVDTDASIGQLQHELIKACGANMEDVCKYSGPGTQYIFGECVFDDAYTKFMLTADVQTTLKAQRGQPMELRELHCVIVKSDAKISQ